jgi:hypothetical protein
VLDSILSWLVLFVPVFLGLLVILVPAKHEDQRSHMRWRYILGASLIVYGGLAWVQQSRTTKASAKDRQQAITDTAAETSARVSKTVGDQYEQMISDLTTQIQSLKDQLSNQSKSFANQLKQTDTELSGSISKVGTPVTKYAQLQFEVAGGSISPPTTLQSIRPDADGVYTVTFAVTNISDTPANAGEMWVYICDQCTWAAEPDGFDKPPGLVEKARHKAFPLLNPGVSLSDLTIKFKITGGPFAYSDVYFNYSCSTCGTISSKLQSIRNYFLPAGNSAFGVK